MQGPSRCRQTAALVLGDGTVFYGRGMGATGRVVGEVCFNTAMTGYQEILTDPSYAGQIVTFTFPHIGNVGVNPDDVESDGISAALGLITREDITAPSNHRAAGGLDDWLAARGMVGISGVDTRGITRRIREKGFFTASLTHDPAGVESLDVAASAREAAEWGSLEGRDMAEGVSGKQPSDWRGGPWTWSQAQGVGGYDPSDGATGPHVVALDYGMKHAIARQLTAAGSRVTVVPAKTSAAEVLALKPSGIFLSNGPGDPAATGTWAVAELRALAESGVPLFGICLGHQMLALALGGRTVKMHQGHHGANHPVKDLETGKVEIVSMNHGFAVDRGSLPAGVEETHVSLFDGSNCGLRLRGKPVFSVQYHPEASPGPRDSHYLFARFTKMIHSSG